MHTRTYGHGYSLCHVPATATRMATAHVACPVTPALQALAEVVEQLSEIEDRVSRERLGALKSDIARVQRDELLPQARARTPRTHAHINVRTLCVCVRVRLCMCVYVYVYAYVASSCRSRAPG